jgi:hypothetical protein
MLPTGRAKLYWLIDLYASGHHDVRTFCREFEHAYNLEVDRSELSAKEQQVFGGLFDKVVFYSPYPSELATIPTYQSAAQIAAAVSDARSKLSVKN